jgi:putative transposase
VFYKWKKNPVSERDWDDAHLIKVALNIHQEDPGCGYRFMSDELANAGIKASERRVRRFCSHRHIWSVFAKKPGLRSKAGPPVHDDLDRRNFHATRANERWLTVFTEHQISEGKLYLCAVKDVHSNRTVEYSIYSPMKAFQAVAAECNAFSLRSSKATVIHSDRGFQCRSKAFMRTLKNNNLIGAMERIKACDDNATTESFFTLLQKMFSISNDGRVGKNYG